LEDLFVVRTLAVINSADTVRVELGVPRCVSESEAVCPYSFTYKGKVFTHGARGLDAFQALDLTLKMLSGELRHNKLLPLGQMYWLEPGDDMGFPETNWAKYPGDSTP